MRGAGASGGWDLMGEDACRFRRLYRGADGNSGSNVESMSRRRGLRLRLWRIGEDGGRELEGPADGSEELPSDNMAKWGDGIVAGGSDCSR